MLIYADPPYVRDTRTASGDAYNHEMTDADHEQLLIVLAQHQGMVLLSGYESDLYSDILQGWVKVAKTTRAELGARRTECLWINPACIEHQRQMRLADVIEN